MAEVAPVRKSLSVHLQVRGRGPRDHRPPTAMEAPPLGRVRVAADLYSHASGRDAAEVELGRRDGPGADADLGRLRIGLAGDRHVFNPTFGVEQYTARYGLTARRAARLADHACILHPGPMNRGVEIAAEVADGPYSVILEQVANGVAVRMAVLYLLSGGRPELAEKAKGGAA